MIVPISGGGSVKAAIYERNALHPGDVIDGPAVVEQDDTTTVVLSGWRAIVDNAVNLMIERRRE
jgi:N-methylhydantoinase A